MKPLPDLEEIEKKWIEHEKKLAEIKRNKKWYEGPVTYTLICITVVAVGFFIIMKILELFFIV